jgi:hypothetical protein
MPSLEVDSPISGVEDPAMQTVVLKVTETAQAQISAQYEIGFQLTDFDPAAQVLSGIFTAANVNNLSDSAMDDMNNPRKIQLIARNPN